MPVRLTKNEILKEVVQCGKNPVYFINNYCRISHPTKGLLPFKMFKFQESVTKDFYDFRFNIVLKARQLGISTLIASYIAWLILFHRNKNVLVLATKLDTAKNLVKKVKLIFKYLPKHIQLAKSVSDNLTSFELDNGSVVKASATSADAGRSEALSLLVVDEAAHVEGLDELWAAIYPALSAGGSCIVTSCVAGDTYIFTNQGIRQIGDFALEEKNGLYDVNKYEILGKEKTREGNLFYNNGLAETRKIITVNAELECTLKHKLWACKNGEFGWFKTEELKIGDYVSMEYGQNIWGNKDNTEDFVPLVSGKHRNVFIPKSITSDISYFLGLFLAEDSIYVSPGKDNKVKGCNVTISCGDDLTNVLNKLELHVSRTKLDDIHYTVSSKTLGEFLKYLGFDFSLKAKDKYLPTRLMSMSRENTISFLKGYFDGDGSTRKFRGEVSVSSASYKMIRQIRMLLLNLGILSLLEKKITKPTKKVKVKSISYNLYLNNENSRKFYNIVGFGFERKQNSSKALDKFNSKRSSSKDVIPFSAEFMRELFSYYNGNVATLNREAGTSFNGILNKRRKYKTEHISRNNVLILYKLVKENLPENRKKYFDKILAHNLIWQPIKAMEKSEAVTYDFSLPETDDFWCHSVIYNGLLGHQTPSGVGNFFHKTYVDAEAGNNDFHSRKLLWNVHPERDQAWFEKETRNMSKREIAQEMLCSFAMSGETVFDPDDIARIRNGVVEPLHRTGIDRNYWIWKPPIEGHIYAMAVDVARGDGKDNSAFHILDLKTMEIVAEYQGKLAVDMFSVVVHSAGKEYGNCLIIVENNSVGVLVIKNLQEVEYPNIYYSEKGSHDYVDQLEAENRTAGVVAGFTTSLKTRPLLIAKAEEYVRNKVITIYSNRMVNEMDTFVWQNGRPEAMRTYNDDLVLSFGILCWVRDVALNVSSKEVEYKKAFINCIMKSTTVLDTTVIGQKGHEVPTPREQRKLYEQYDWIYKS